MHSLLLLRTFVLYGTFFGSTLSIGFFFFNLMFLNFAVMCLMCSIFFILLFGSPSVLDWGLCSSFNFEELVIMSLN